MGRCCGDLAYSSVSLRVECREYTGPVITQLDTSSHIITTRSSEWDWDAEGLLWRCRLFFLLFMELSMLPVFAAHSVSVPSHHGSAGWVWRGASKDLLPAGSRRLIPATPHEGSQLSKLLPGILPAHTQQQQQQRSGTRPNTDHIHSSNTHQHSWGESNSLLPRERGGEGVCVDMCAGVSVSRPALLVLPGLYLCW